MGIVLKIVSIITTFLTVIGSLSMFGTEIGTSVGIASLLVGIGISALVFAMGEIYDRVQSIDKHLDNIEYILTNTIWTDNQE